MIEHKWFSTLDLKKMEAKEMTPPYKPNVPWCALVRQFNRMFWLSDLWFCLRKDGISALAVASVNICVKCSLASLVLWGGQGR